MGGLIFSQVSINLSFLEAAKGTSKTIKYSRLETCTPCGGKGVSKGSQLTTCRTCRGSGQETRMKGSFYFTSTCRSCGGMGKINPDPCSSCNGAGSAQKTSSITVEIPPGVAEGETFSVRREGNKMSGQVGDLIVNVTVDKSPTFIRKKNDIYVSISISLYEALFGGNITVPTIGGDVEMKIPPGTQPDDMKRMSGRGIYKSSTGERGHQFVKFKVEIPRSLTPVQQSLLEKCFGTASSTEAEADGKTEAAGVNQWFDKLRGWLKWY